MNRNEKGGQWLLPFSDISLLWLRNSGQDDPVHMHRKGDMLIDVWVRSDNGNGEYGEPKLQPEDSGSELRIYFMQCEMPKEESFNWYYQVWSKTDYPPLGQVAQCDVPGYRAYGEALSLGCLTDEAAVRDSITALRQRVSAKLNQII